MDKREFLKSSAVLALATVAPFRLWAQEQHPVPPARRRPMNLLFITADDLDWSLPGFISGRKGFTPNLDALAARSHVFVNNRTVAPICMPAREAIMTGLLPHHSGGIGFTPVNEGTPTLTALLQQSGYYAAAIHKVDHMLPQQCFPWDYVQQSKDRSVLVHAEGLKAAAHEARNLSKPFFVNCNSNDPHRPFYGSTGGNKVDHDETGEYRVAREITPSEVTVPPMLDDLPDIRTELAQYWNSVQRLDVAVGNILKALEETGEADNTVIVFSSDHGMPFPFAKATCYDHGTRVPVLISWPGMGAPRRFDNLTTNVDILPTLLDLLGVAPPSKLDGRSWLPIIRGEASAEPEFQFTYVNTVSSGMSYPMRGIQDRRYALLFSPWSNGQLDRRLESMAGLTFNAMRAAAGSNPAIARRVEEYVKGIPLAFYDLREDPGQRVNLIEDRRHAARITRMKQALLDEMQRTADPQLANFKTLLAGGVPTVPQDPERYKLRNGGGE